MLHVSIACNANGNCNGNGYGKCCHIASQYPFSPCVFVCVWLLFFATHFYNGIYIFFAVCCCCCCVCVHVLHQQLLFNVLFPVPQNLLIEGCSAFGEGGMGVRHAEVKFASFFKRLRINFSTIHSTSTNAKKLLPSSCSLPLSLSLSLSFYCRPSRVLD